MIDLDPVQRILTETQTLVTRLNRLDLDETDAIAGTSPGDLRRRRAQISQDLQLLATRFELAAQLTRVEYWHARGNPDPLHPERTL